MGSKIKSIIFPAVLLFLLFSPVLSIADTSAESIRQYNIEKIQKALARERYVLREDDKTLNKVEGSLRKYMTAQKSGRLPLRKETEKPDDYQLEKVRIMIKTKGNTDNLAESISRHGGRVIKEQGEYKAVEVPADKIQKIIEENDAVEYARLPRRFYPFGKVTEGVNLTGAHNFHNLNSKGAGVKIAVIDVGFKGLTEAIANGELPENVITRDFSGRGLETEYKHGTACAEIVHNMSPEAELHLLKIGDEIGALEVFDYSIENGIDIISLSIGTFGTGPGDGTGPLHDTFNSLREAGILVVAAAGNYANLSFKEEGYTFTFGSHWQGSFRSSYNSELHQFIPNDPESIYNVIGAGPAWNDDGEEETGEVSILMRWNDWPVSNIDYDMYLFEYNYSTGEIGDVVSGSAGYQTGSQEPVEYISIDISGSEDDIFFYALVVIREDTKTPRNIPLEIYLGGTSMFVPFEGETSAIAHSQSSMLEPADAESVLAVGAIDYMNWTTGPQEDYSSQGPTNAWNNSRARVKPDVMAPSGVTTFTYGDSVFFGTSAAAPHVAGAAALILSRNPGMTPDELQKYIEIRATDMGTPGKDNLYGWGRLNMVNHGFPIANAGPDQIVDARTPVALDGSNSYDQNGYITEYKWEQISGIRVTLSDAAAVSPTFIAPAVAYAGALLSFKLTVTDNNGNKDTDTCIVNVSWVNIPPVAFDQTITTDENQAVVIFLSATDEDGDTLNYYIVEQVKHGVLIGYFPWTYIPEENYYGSDSFTFKVNDGYDYSDIATVTININYVNKPPVAHNRYLRVMKNGSLDILLTAHDPEGDNLTFERLTDPLSGSLSGTVPNLIYTPNEHYHGSDSFTFKVNDGLHDSNIAAVNISVLEKTPPGDIDGDLWADLKDLIIALQIAARISVEPIEIHMNADVNRDGKIGMAEAIYIMREIAGMGE